MDENRRKSRRIRTNFWVRFFRESVDSTMKACQKGWAENCSSQGMFIVTDHLFSQGSVFTLEFEVGSDMKSRTLIRVRAIVRWVQQFVEHPGMGVEFVLFDGVSDRKFRHWFMNMQA